MNRGDEVSILPGTIQDFEKHWTDSGEDINAPQIRKWIEEDFDGHQYFLSHTQDKGHKLYFTGFLYNSEEFAWISDEPNPQKHDLSWNVEVPIQLVIPVNK